jgi:Ca2+-binding RTX toxin-like protein
VNASEERATAEALTSGITPDGAHPISRYLNSLDGTSGPDVQTGTGINGNDVYGFGGNDTETGGTGNTFLNGGAGANSVTGSVGNDVIVYHSTDTVEGGGAGGFDTLRIDQGAIYNTSLEVSGAPSGGFANATVDLTTATPALSHFSEILITQEAIAE